MIKDISRYVGNLVSSIDNKIIGVYDPVAEVTETCKTKYARPGKYVTDESNNQFLITEVETDEYIKSGTADGTLSLAVPYYINGTKIAANREWSIADENLFNKTPIVWLLHDLRYFKYGRESVFDWESDIRVFFLDETDILNYYTKDHITNVVEPMTELALLFIEAVNLDRRYLTIDQYEMINFTRFGTEQENGYFQNILDANLSGVELRLKLTRYKENCKNC
jgi:hypothetical protein